MSNNVRFLEASEVQRLMETPSLKSLTGLRNRCMTGLMYEAGLRTYEVVVNRNIYKWLIIILYLRLNKMSDNVSYVNMIALLRSFSMFPIAQFPATTTHF